MKLLIKSITVLISFMIFSSIANDSDAIMLPSNLLSKGNLKAEYEGATPSAFNAAEDNTRRVNGLNSGLNSADKSALVSTPLTGKLMIQLQDNVDVDTFLAEFDVNVEWQNNRQLILVSVPDEVSVEALFALRDALANNADVKWVEVDKTSKRNTID